jgi:hypothetical protein
MRTINLQELPIPRLLFQMLKERFTGSVELGQWPLIGSRTVLFRGGMPLYTDWMVAEDALGEVLIGRGRLDRDTLTTAMRTVATEGRKLGEVLVEQHGLTSEDLTAALGEQCRRKLLHLFKLRDEDLIINPMEHVSLPAEVRIQVNVLSLIREGIYRYFGEIDIFREMGDDLRRTLGYGRRFARYGKQFAFGSQAKAFLQRMGTPITVADLPAEDEERMRAAQVIYTLWATEMLEMGDMVETLEVPEPSGLRPPPSAPPDADASQSTVALAAQQAAAEAEADAEAARHIVPTLRVEGDLAMFDPTQLGDVEREVESRLTLETVSPSPAETERAKAFAAALSEIEIRLATVADPHRLLGIEVTAPEAAVVAAWMPLGEMFNPATLDERGLAFLRERVEAVYDALLEARARILHDDVDLDEYVASASGTQFDRRQILGRDVEVEALIRAADKQLAAGNISRASHLYGEALSRQPDDPDAQAAMLYSQFSLLDDDAGEYASTLLTAMLDLGTEHPGCARAHYLAGKVLKRTGGSTELIRTAFENALKADAGLVDAKRELHALSIRAREDRERPSESMPRRGLKALLKR